MKWCILLLLLSTAIFAADTEEFWKNKQEYMSSRTIATAGAQTASTLKNDGAYLNPAASYSVKGRFIMGLDGFYVSDGVPNQFMFSIVDSKTTKRTSGLSGGSFLKFYNYTEEEDSYSSFSTGISYAMPLFKGAILGVGGKYLKFKKNDTNYINTVTFDVGLIYMFSPYISLSVVGYNLTAIDKLEAPLAVTSAIRVTDNEMFSLEFDLTSDFSAPDFYEKNETALYKYSFGGEIKLGNDLTILAGYQIDSIIDENYFGLGVEYFIPKTRVELGFSYMQSTTSDYQVFSFALKMYL